MVRALDDIRILDLTHVVNGPYATLMLSFLGAEVIKVEPPGRGEKARSLMPVRDVEHESYPFIMLNSNKRGITLNLKTTRGRYSRCATSTRPDWAGSVHRNLAVRRCTRPNDCPNLDVYLAGRHLPTGGQRLA